MDELVFVGLGLNDERGISLRGLEETREAYSVFTELYTSLMPELSVQELEKLVGRVVFVVSRRDLEEEGGRMILQEAKKGKVVLLVPGDPLIATTHVDLRVRAEKQGIKTRLIHGASIVSAVVGLCGLQNYKFGRSVTIPFSEDGFPPETPYRVLLENKLVGLHTLCFLDIDVEKKQYMTIREGLQTLLDVEKRKKGNVVLLDTPAVGISRAGSRDPTVKAGYVRELITYDFGPPPQSIVFPGRLHFMEAEALITLADAPESIRERVK